MAAIRQFVYWVDGNDFDFTVAQSEIDPATLVVKHVRNGRGLLHIPPFQPSIRVWDDIASAAINDWVRATGGEDAALKVLRETADAPIQNAVGRKVTQITTKLAFYTMRMARRFLGTYPRTRWYW